LRKLFDDVHFLVLQESGLKKMWKNICVAVVTDMLKGSFE